MSHSTGFLCGRGRRLVTHFLESFHEGHSDYKELSETGVRGTNVCPTVEGIEKNVLCNFPWWLNDSVVPKLIVSTWKCCPPISETIIKRQHDPNCGRPYAMLICSIMGFKAMCFLTCKIKIQHVFTGLYRNKFWIL